MRPPGYGKADVFISNMRPAALQRLGLDYAALKAVKPDLVHVNLVGFARVLDETGMAELWAERVLDPRMGLLAPFLAAAIVKTLQGNSLSAVLTASGMVEPMLPALGLDSASGRALAAAAAGAGGVSFLVTM